MPEHIDLAKAAFNKTWEYLDQTERTADDDRAMLAHAAASWYHWRQVGEAKNRSVSDWQMSRVFAVLEVPSLAKSFGDACLETSEAEGLDPFYVAMAHEALARAAMIGGDDAAKNRHLTRIHELRSEVTDPEEIEVLDSDLATLE